MTTATPTVFTLTDDAGRFTMAFTTFVLLQLANVLAVRGGSAGVLGHHMFTNRWVWAAIGTVLAVQIAVLHVGFMQTLFDTTALSLQQWLIAIGVATLPILYAQAASLARGGGGKAGAMAPQR